MSELNLLPCPFCGGPADFECCGGEGFATWSVGCVNENEDCIGYQLLAHYNRKCEAAEAWNKRAPSTKDYERGQRDLAKEVFALCEDTVEKNFDISHDDTEGKQGAYARGRIFEAKGIAKAIGAILPALTRR